MNKINVLKFKNLNKKSYLVKKLQRNKIIISILLFLEKKLFTLDVYVL